MALGTAAGGWKILKTMGGGVTKLSPASGFAVQTTAALVIEFMSFIGAPVSTTQVITTSIMGAGTAERATAVKIENCKQYLYRMGCNAAGYHDAGIALCVWVIQLFMS